MLLSGFNVAAMIFMFLFLRRLYHTYPPLQDAIRAGAASSTAVEATSRKVCAICHILQVFVFFVCLLERTHPLIAFVLQAGCLVEGLAVFLRCGCATILLAYAMLFLTVLSFQSLMTAFVLWKGLPVLWVGVGRGLAAFFGFLGASLYPVALKRLGFSRTATISLWYQFVLAAAACASFFVGTQAAALSVVLLIVPVVRRTQLSRFAGVNSFRQWGE